MQNVTKHLIIFQTFKIFEIQSKIGKTSLYSTCHINHNSQFHISVTCHDICGFAIRVLDSIAGVGIQGWELFNGQAMAIVCLDVIPYTYVIGYVIGLMTIRLVQFCLRVCQLMKIKRYKSPH